MSNGKNSKKLAVRIMAWVLALIMLGSTATLAITLILDMLAH